MTDNMSPRKRHDGITTFDRPRNIEHMRKALERKKVYIYFESDDDDIKMLMAGNGSAIELKPNKVYEIDIEHPVLRVWENRRYFMHWDRPKDKGKHIPIHKSISKGDTIGKKSVDILDDILGDIV